MYGSSALRKGAGNSEVTRAIPLPRHSKISSKFQELRGNSCLYKDFCCPICPHPGAGETAEFWKQFPSGLPQPVYTALYLLPQQVSWSLNLPKQNPQQTNIDFGTTTSRGEAWPLRNRNSDGSRREKAQKYPCFRYEPVPPLVTCSDWPHTEELDCRQQQKH